MESRTVTLPDDVYEKLREERRTGESVADVIDRLLGPRDLSEFWGAWETGTTEAARRTIAERRSGSSGRIGPARE